MSRHDPSESEKHEIGQAEDETSVTAEEMITPGPKAKKKRKRKMFFLRLGYTLWSSWRKTYILLILMLAAAIIILPVAGFYLIKMGSTFTEQKGAFVEHVQELQELTTAEAYTKVLVERTDNELFGQSIGVNLPGTKRNLLVVIPGSVKAGIDLSDITESDLTIDDREKTVHLSVPPAEFLGGAEIYFDQVEVYSVEGLFRTKADIEEGYELANEAKNLILEEASEQGVLQTAERNAEKTLKEMFSFAGYELEVEFKE
ncbi:MULTISPECIES: DUF4230 domain-containing protein [unclassified Sporosarcina]|uniref:DUF4230 domain-containing protein n=1 Tax=unclassified Sporosarcina TaxID=2647733 RepID=UPI00203B453D|nr:MULTISPECIES: DUF4230 domain-containing protein [unclassified Sporosarcina]GKV67378.1 hypothetical protein NCCP2331_35310 [Sporosarcina sp. NCCP-2331]GLB57734.1 hypothetical protein NCCP2378_35240 [Sporosarcina sp. NCCP-2378]